MKDSPFEDPTPGDGTNPSPAPGQAAKPGPIQRLFDGDATGPPTSQIEADYGLPQHWALAIRGGIRTATGDGVPPIVEIALGVAMGVLQQQQDTEESSDWDDNGREQIEVNQ